MDASKPFRALSLDGGGMRGTYAAAYLSALAGGYAKRRSVPHLDIGKAFDLIVGTSTGAIIGCALAKGIRLSAVLDLYRHQGAQIFRRRIPAGITGVLVDLFRRKRALRKGDSALRAALETQFDKTTLREVYQERGIALAIPAVEMSQHRAWVFKTPHLPSLQRDSDYRLVDVCLATSAAPIYRSLAHVPYPDGTPGGHVFSDGGLWANNPVMVALLEALRIAQPGRPLEIFCLGTSSRPGGEQISLKAVHRGLKQWKFGGEAVGLGMNAQQFVYDQMAMQLASHLNRPCSIIRFPQQPIPADMMQYLELDDVRVQAIDALVRLGRNDADMTNSRMNGAPSAQDVLIDRLFASAPVLEQPTAEPADAILDSPPESAAR